MKNIRKTLTKIFDKIAPAEDTRSPPERFGQSYKHRTFMPK